MTTDHSAPQSDPWATLDAAVGDAAAPEVDGAELGDMAFLGRCSTEDNQDPETSRGWQRGNAEKFVGPLAAGGQVVPLGVK